MDAAPVSRLGLARLLADRAPGGNRLHGRHRLHPGGRRSASLHSGNTEPGGGARRRNPPRVHHPDSGERVLRYLQLRILDAGLSRAEGGGHGMSPDAKAFEPPRRDMSGMGDLETERRNPRSRDIDRMSALEIVDLINGEDRLVPEAVGRVRHELAGVVELVAERLRRGGRLIYVGAGTSGRLGVLDAAECPPTFGTDPAAVRGIIAGGYGALVRAKEGAEDIEGDGARDLSELDPRDDDVIVGIATSGVTPYVHGALREGRRAGAATVFVCCSPARGGVEADITVAPVVGPEVITGSTRMKAGTATKLVLNTITTGAMVLLGKTYENLMVDLTATCDKLRDRAIRILRETAGVDTDEAVRLLTDADGSVKRAIVMARSG
ncbi:MAG: N-acetylmuramic acid 6-phosphate etherase, partial [Candidatus Eisenbacteria bacterium]|nr:N-acetylmuramic acid 6-phosphate etherase [Candidatus Eisenbacteria bacterium]